MVSVMTNENDKNESDLPMNYIPTWEIPVALKTADWTIKGGGKFIEWLKCEGPLAVQIIDSYKNNSSYVVKFHATNMTIHSIYINSFKLSFPNIDNVILKPESKGSIGMGVGNKVQTDSTLINSGGSLDFIIEFDTPEKNDLKKGLLKNHVPMGAGKVRFLILNEETERDKEVKFSIRIDE
jgi:hypothetical protein